MTSRSEPTNEGQRVSASHALARTALPLGVVAVAYGLWFLSDRFLYIGILDRATFGWAVVVPLWLVTPAVAGFAWRRLDLGSRRLAAAMLGAFVGTVAAILLWIGLQPNCEFGAIGGPSRVLTQAVTLAGIIGLGLGVSAFQASQLVAAGRLRFALVMGTAIQLAFFGAALGMATLVLQRPTCSLPS